MKTLGLLGGMSWESTAIYYRHLNEICRERAGGLHSAELALWSFDFDAVARRQHAGDWDGAGRLLADAAARLQAIGAAAIVLCTNTMHCLADRIQDALDIPLLHIADATARAIKASPSQRPILLGTAFTMEQPFYRERMRSEHGIELTTPDAEGRAFVHRTIYEELCRGEINPASKARMLTLIAQLRQAGGDGVILGCTELCMIIEPADLDIPVFDTTRLHAEYAAAFALA